MVPPRRVDSGAVLVHKNPAHWPVKDSMKVISFKEERIMMESYSRGYEPAQVDAIAKGEDYAKFA